ncbi:MAG TPA: hypothetical protein VEJ23_07475 [Solirubrobacteraceae bacterium]|nr:hypothetical protein [Solirubrobacteraceae bacterium]
MRATSRARPRTQRTSLRGSRADGGQARLHSRLALTVPSGGEPALQRRTVRMLDLGRLVPLDLPADALPVAVEQQERAAQAQRVHQALCEHRCSPWEHVFVR